MLKISTTENPSIAILHLDGGIDSTTTAQLQHTAFELMASGKNQCILDLAGVDYISSAGLRSILLITHQLLDQQGQLVVCQLQPTVHHVFTMTGFEKIISQFATLEQTLRHLESSRR